MEMIGSNPGRAMIYRFFLQYP